MPKVVPEYKDRARARIVQAARLVFHRKGFRSSTMEDIAEEVGVSKGALYLYFPTKSDLLVAVQTRSREEILERWSGLLAGGDVAEGMARSLDEVLAGEIDPSVFHELLVESAENSAVRRALVEDRRADAKMMRGFLVQLEARGRIPKMKHPDATAGAVLKLFEGTVMQRMLHGQAAEARRSLVQELRLVLGT